MKIRISVFLSILIFMNGCAKSENINGFWSGTMEMNGKTVDLSIDFDTEETGFSSYDLMLVDAPLSNLTIKKKAISFSLDFFDAEVVFNGKLSGNEIFGKATINGGPPNMNITFKLSNQSEKPVKPYSIESLTIKSNDVNLSADIYKPKTDELHPAIVLLPGSNRDNPKSNLTYYADFFVKLGFEVLIFDKRGSGKSTGNSITATYEDLTNDAIACLETLAKRESVNNHKIGLWGLSQGGMLLPYIASKTRIPSFLISIVPDTDGMHEAAAFSDSLRVVRRGYSPEEGRIVAESHRKVALMISKGSNYKDVENYIKINVRRYSFMNLTGLYENITIDEESFKGAYWQGRKYNFYKYWQNLNIKALCLFGGADDLVDPVKNVNRLSSLDNKNIQIFTFKNANHVLKKSFNPLTDTEFDFPRIIEGYTEYVEKWIKSEIYK